jgi:hypothetical protein
MRAIMLPSQVNRKQQRQLLAPQASKTTLAGASLVSEENSIKHSICLKSHKQIISMYWLTDPKLWFVHCN